MGVSPPFFPFFFSFFNLNWAINLSIKISFCFVGPFCQTGLYRLSGAERTVRELKEKFLRGKTVPLLSKVEDIHAITGLLKDFLRNLKEPLLTFRLNRAFMEAAGVCVCVILNQSVSNG